MRIEVGNGFPVIANAVKTACSPGAIATLTGKWLGPDDPVADVSGNSTELRGVRVTVNGELVPLVFAGKTRASFLCPAGQAGAALEVVLATPVGTSAPVSLKMQAANPVLLSVDDSPQGLVFHTGSAQLATARDVRSAGHPAQPGDSLSVRTTGVDPKLPLSLKIGGEYAVVTAIAPAGDEPGVWVIQATVPIASAIGDAVPVQIETVSPRGRQLQSNSVTIAVERSRR